MDKQTDYYDELTKDGKDCFIIQPATHAQLKRLLADALHSNRTLEEMAGRWALASLKLYMGLSQPEQGVPADGKV
jgi:hypothetical protein